MLEMVTGAVPELVSVAICAAPLMKTLCVPKASSGGISVRFVLTALRLITCGLLGSLSVKVRVAFLVPALVGVKVTFTVQLLGLSPTSGKTPFAQVLVSVNSESPVMATLVNLRVVVVLKLRNVTVPIGLGVPTCCAW